MAYPPSSNFPSQQQPQYQQSLQNIYQSDQYPQQDFTQQPQDGFSQQNQLPQNSFNQQQNAYQQDSLTQEFQPFLDQQNSYPQQSSLPSTNSYSQPNQFGQQNPSESLPGQPPRQQLPRQGQQSHSQYSQQPPSQSQYHQQSQRSSQFTPLSQNQYSQSASPVHQNTYSQQGTQPNTYPQPSQAQPNRLGQRNSLAQPNPYNQHNQATQSHSQQTSLPPHPNQLPGSGAQNHPNGFSTQHGQQNFSQAQQTHISQQQVQQSHLHPPGDVAGTYQLFFTGRDDPRACMLIGEDTKPVYLTFETQESNLNQQVRTNVYKNTRDFCAKLDWGTGGFLGNATIGNRHFPMADLVLPGSTESARRFTSVEGKQFEWRRIREDTTAYDLFMAPNVRIALFRKYNQLTAIGPSHGLIQYTFSNDILLIEALLSLLLNRWIDMNRVQFSG